MDAIAVGEALRSELNQPSLTLDRSPAVAWSLPPVPPPNTGGACHSAHGKSNSIFFFSSLSIVPDTTEKWIIQPWQYTEQSPRKHKRARRLQCHCRSMDSDQDTAPRATPARAHMTCPRGRRGLERAGSLDLSVGILLHTVR